MSNEDNSTFIPRLILPQPSEPRSLRASKACKQDLTPSFPADNAADVKACTQAQDLAGLPVYYQGEQMDAALQAGGVKNGTVKLVRPTLLILDPEVAALERTENLRQLSLEEARGKKPHRLQDSAAKTSIHSARATAVPSRGTSIRLQPAFLAAHSPAASLNISIHSRDGSELVSALDREATIYFKVSKTIVRKRTILNFVHKLSRFLLLN